MVVKVTQLTFWLPLQNTVSSRNLCFFSNDQTIVTKDLKIHNCKIDGDFYPKVRS